MSNQVSNQARSEVREVERIVAAHKQRDGGGFIVRRPVPSLGIELVDPFLLIDEMGPVDYGPGQAVGAPDHPHRGFETVTYVLEGEFEHEDSAGHRGALRAGDVQWMTAGAGIIHAESAVGADPRAGGGTSGSDLGQPPGAARPAPRYQEIAADKDPRPDPGRKPVRVIAGEALWARVIDTPLRSPAPDWSIDPSDGPCRCRATRPPSSTRSEGRWVSVTDRAVEDGRMALLGAGDGRSVRGGAGPGRLPRWLASCLGEPVARYGRLSEPGGGDHPGRAGLPGGRMGRSRTARATDGDP